MIVSPRKYSAEPGPHKAPPFYTRLPVFPPSFDAPAEGRSVISGPPDGQRRTALGWNVKRRRFSVSVLWHGRSCPVWQLSDAVRRTQEKCREPVYRPPKRWPRKAAGRHVSPPDGQSAAGRAKRHTILFQAYRVRLLHFISPAARSVSLLRSGWKLTRHPQVGSRPPHFVNIFILRWLEELGSRL